MKNIGTFLVIAGIILILIGFLLRLGLKMRWLGQMPGDIAIRKGSWTLYFPLGTSLLLSFLLSLLLIVIFTLTGKK